MCSVIVVVQKMLQMLLTAAWLVASLTLEVAGSKLALSCFDAGFAAVFLSSNYDCEIEDRPFLD
jgi:hypothetical protein